MIEYPSRRRVGASTRTRKNAMRVRVAKSALLLAAFFGLAPGVPAQSQADAETGRCNDAVVKRVGKHFRLADFAYPAQDMSPSVEDGGLIVAGVCKPWPTDKSRTIAAFAYDGGDEYAKQLLVAVLEGPNNRVAASYKGTISEDAATEVSSHSLSLDTARYVLAKNTRAFGLRLNRFHDRCTFEGGFDDELTLFVVEAQAIRPVLTETMSHWSYGEGNRCGGEDVPRTDANVLISVEPTRTSGFADLRLVGVRSDKKKRASAVVKYDGQRYDLAPWKAAFGAWWD